ncbi:MAG: thioredoxin family protein [Bacteroidetes bacterium]|nr:thioredoxin family protein [Bacteroidota bacterium]
MNKIVILLFVLLTAFTVNTEKPIPSMLHKQVNDFSLKVTDNTFFSLANNKDAKGYIVIFTCNHCPFAKLYGKRLNQLNTKYKKLGVPLIAINSMDTLVYEEESFELMQVKAKTAKYNFPYLQDAMQSVGKSFNAAHTPQAFVIWQENSKWIVKYSGAVDDNGEHPEKATAYVANAVDELLKGIKVSKPETQSFGCRIFYRK